MKTMLNTVTLCIFIIMLAWVHKLWLERVEGRSEWNKERSCQTEQNCDNGEDFTASYK